MKIIRFLIKNEKGAAMTEYVLILSLIAVAATVAFSGLATKITGTLTKISNSLPQ